MLPYLIGDDYVRIKTGCTDNNNKEINVILQKKAEFGKIEKFNKDWSKYKVFIFYAKSYIGFNKEKFDNNT